MCAAQARLQQERKTWRKDHPFGFVAKPEVRPDGSTDMMTWRCLIPGKEGTDWEGGKFPLTMAFSSDYPSKPPACRFPSGFFHPNVYNSGAVCLSIIGELWKPSLTHSQILLGIQELLCNPNNSDPAQTAAHKVFHRNLAQYSSLVKEQARRYRDGAAAGPVEPLRISTRELNNADEATVIS